MKNITISQNILPEEFTISEDELYAIDVCNFSQPQKKSLELYFTEAARGIAKCLLSKLLCDISTNFENGIELQEVNIQLSWFSAICAFHPEWCKPLEPTKYSISACYKDRTAALIERLYNAKLSHSIFKEAFLNQMNKLLGEFTYRKTYDLPVWNWTVNLNILP